MTKVATMVCAVMFFALSGLAFGAMSDQGMGTEMMSGCGMQGSMMAPEHHVAKYLQGITLDDKQKNAIGVIESKLMKEMITRGAVLRIAQIELKELLSQDSVDMKAVELKVAQIEKMKSELALSHIKAIEDIKMKLSPEQRKQMKELMEAKPMMHDMNMSREQGHKMNMK
jgi:Spy/CpxP family protein refolding chaperone